MVKIQTRLPVLGVVKWRSTRYNSKNFRWPFVIVNENKFLRPKNLINKGIPAEVKTVPKVGQVAATVLGFWSLFRNDYSSYRWHFASWLDCLKIRLQEKIRGLTQKKSLSITNMNQFLTLQSWSRNRCSIEFILFNIPSFSQIRLIWSTASC